MNITVTVEFISCDEVKWDAKKKRWILCFDDKEIKLEEKYLNYLSCEILEEHPTYFTES